MKKFNLQRIRVSLTPRRSNTVKTCLFTFVAYKSFAVRKPLISEFLSIIVSDMVRDF